MATSVAACGHKDRSGDDAGPMLVSDHGFLTIPAKSPLRTHLVVEAVGGGAAEHRLEAPAAVEADPTRVSNIISPLTGRVVDLRVRLGDRVRRGQALAILASGDLAQANADVVKAADALELAKKALDRARGVREAGGAAQKDIEAAQSASNQAAAELDRAKERQRALNGSATRSQLVLAAPQDGVVTALSIAPGSQVGDPTATLMTVTNIQRVLVTANVAEGDAGAVAVGQEADIRLTAFPGRILHGRVTSVNALLEPDTRRRKVRIALDNHDGVVLPNMYGTVTLLRAAPSTTASVSVPQSALLMNNDTISVMVEVRPWVFQRRVVQIGDETETTVQVVNGLAPGERVVVRGGVLLND
ncbi:MAG: efflux RND transporter periplasmic adaptor subunit [Caulobacteraceae bacterium]